MQKFRMNGKSTHRLGIDDLEFSTAGSLHSDDTPKKGVTEVSVEDEIEKVTVTYSDEPVPQACLPEIGTVTGVVRLYKDRISGGISEQRGISNGFFVNVMGRIVNANDPSFGEKT